MQGSLAKEIQVGEIDHAAGCMSPRLTCFHYFIGGIHSQVELSATLRILTTGAGIADSPWIKKQAGTGQQVTGIPRRLLTLQNITVFLTDVAVLNIKGARVYKAHAVRWLRGGNIENVKNGKARLVARGKDMDPRERIGIAKLDRGLLSTNLHVLDMKWLQVCGLQVPVTGEEEILLRVMNTRGHAEVDDMPDVLQVQLVVSGRKIINDHRSILDSSGFSMVGMIAPLAPMQQ